MGPWRQCVGAALLGAVLALQAAAQEPGAGQVFQGRIVIDRSAPADGDVGCARFLVVDGVRRPVRGPLGTLLEARAGREARVRGELVGSTIVPSAVLALVDLDEEGQRRRDEELFGPGDAGYTFWRDLHASAEASEPSPGRVFDGDPLEVVDVRVVGTPPTPWARVRAPDGREGWLSPGLLGLEAPVRARARVVDGPGGPRLEVEGGLRATGRAARDVLGLGARPVLLEGYRVGATELHVTRVLLRPARPVTIRGGFGAPSRAVRAGEVLALYFVSGGRASVLRPRSAGAPEAVGPVAVAELSPRGPRDGLVDGVPR